MNKTLINNEPLMVDAEVTLKFVIPNICYMSDIEGDEQALMQLVQQELEELGIANFVDDTDFYLIDAKIIL